MSDSKKKTIMLCIILHFVDKFNTCLLKRI